MVYRFGEGPGGQFARIVQSVAAIATTVGMLAYLSKGVGLFLSTFIPLEPIYCTLILLAVATIYTMVSGFYGVVYTDLFQSGIILIAVLTISIMAFVKISDVASFSGVAEQVTGSREWISCYPQWKTTMPVGREYEPFKYLFLVGFFYLVRNIFGGMGDGFDPKYFGARSDKECGKLTFLWTWLMMFRWPMMMGFAVLGIYLVNEHFPDMAVLAQASDLIKDNFVGIDKSRWADTLSSIRLHPERFTDLAAGLQNILGENWATKLNLLGFEGNINPEKILPAVILFNIRPGFRGLIMVALLAASMSTFDSTVNKTAGYFTRDLYQRYFRRRASNRELIYASWFFIVVLVGAGFALAYFTESINEIWDWLVMGLGGGLLIPIVIRLYWWRFNGGGFAIGTIVGLAAAVAQKAFWPLLVANYGWRELAGWEMFLLMGSIGLAASILGTYLTRPTDRKVLENFYRSTRPFGLWGPLRKLLPIEQQMKVKRENRNDLLAVPFALAWQISLFLLPMELIIHNYRAFWITLPIFLVGLTGLYFLWYKKLPED